MDLSKITVKYFLNKRLKPKVVKGVKYFSPYARVSYAGKNAQFPFDWTMIYFEEDYEVEGRFSEKSFDRLVLNIQDEDVKEANDFITDFIKSVVEYEVKKYRSKFTLKGIGKRIHFYNECLCCSYDLEAINSLLAFFRNQVSRKQYNKILARFESKDLLEVIEFVEKKYDSKIRDKISKNLWLKIESRYLFKSFSFDKEDSCTYFDWLKGDAFIEFKSYLENEKYLKKKSLHRKEIKKLPMLNSTESYLEEMDDFLNDEKEEIEADFI